MNSIKFIILPNFESYFEFLNFAVRLYPGNYDVQAATAVLSETSQRQSISRGSERFRKQRATWIKMEMQRKFTPAHGKKKVPARLFAATSSGCLFTTQKLLHWKFFSKPVLHPGWSKSKLRESGFHLRFVLGKLYKISVSETWFDSSSENFSSWILELFFFNFLWSEKLKGCFNRIASKKYTV